MHDRSNGRTTLADKGWTDAFQTGDEFGAFLKSEDERVAGVLSELGLRRDLRHQRTPRRTPGRPRRRACGDRADPSCVVLFLFALGALVLFDTARLGDRPGQRGPVGPKAVPTVIGGAALVVAVLLARDVLRGGRGEPEGGEDMDLSTVPTGGHVLILAGGVPGQHRADRTGRLADLRRHAVLRMRIRLGQPPVRPRTRSSPSHCRWAPGTCSRWGSASPCRSAS